MVKKKTFPPTYVLNGGDHKKWLEGDHDYLFNLFPCAEIDQGKQKRSARIVLSIESYRGKRLDLDK